jgi:hypothetical protein
VSYACFAWPCLRIGGPLLYIASVSLSPGPTECEATIPVKVSGILFFEGVQIFFFLSNTATYPMSRKCN